MLTNIKLISGRSNPDLSLDISERLGIPLTKIKIKDFANTELEVEINENIRGCNIYIIQTGASYQNKTVNDYILELFSIIDSCKRSSAKSINVILPFFPYSRSDKKIESRVSIMASTIIHLLESMQIDRIIAMDLHAGQIQGFTMKPFDNLYAIKLHCDHLKNTLFKDIDDENIINNYVLVSPDIGGIKRVEAYATRLGLKHVVMHKHRNYDKPGVVLHSELIGGVDKVKNKICIIIDDIIDSMGTMISCSLELMKYEAKEIIIIATHSILSGEAINRINQNDCIKKVIITNTLPQSEHLKKCSKLEIVNVGCLLSEVIKRIEIGGSISELFK